MIYNKLNDRFTFTREEIRQAKENGISSDQLHNRVNNAGWSLERALTEPLDERKKGKSKYFTKDEIEEGRENGIRLQTMVVRLKSGWDRVECYTKPINYNYKGTSLMFNKKLKQEIAFLKKEINGLNDEKEKLEKFIMDSNWQTVHYKNLIFSQNEKIKKLREENYRLSSENKELKSIINKFNLTGAKERRKK